MIAKLKKILPILLALISTICIAFAFGGCNKSVKVSGQFYTLRQAYENGWLNEDDLKSIADYHNNKKTYPIPLSNEEEVAIKETAAFEVRSDERNQRPDAGAEEFFISEYYGVYNDCYAVIIDDSYVMFPGIDDYWENIGDVSIHYLTPVKIKIWRPYK